MNTSDLKDLCDFMNANDEWLVSIVAHQFDEAGHDFIASRIRWYFAADYSMIRPLRDIYILQYEMKPQPFLAFYEDVYRFRNVPHYEDAWAIATLITSALLAILSPIIGLEYGRWREKRVGSRGKSEVEPALADQIRLLRHIKLRYRIRAQYYHAQITSTEFHECCALLDASWDNSNLLSALPSNVRGLVEVGEGQSSFPATSPEAFSVIAEKVMKITARRQPTQLGSRVEQHTYVTGLPASPGAAVGEVIAVRSPSDVVLGDTQVACLLSEFSPELTAFVRSAKAVIGVGCGGMTGHLAVFCRSVGIPCILLREEPSVADGDLVIVDGNTGRLYSNLRLADIVNLAQWEERLLK